MEAIEHSPCLVCDGKGFEVSFVVGGKTAMAIIDPGRSLPGSPTLCMVTTISLDDYIQ